MSEEEPDVEVEVEEERVEVETEEVQRGSSSDRPKPSSALDSAPGVSSSPASVPVLSAAPVSVHCPLFCVIPCCAVGSSARRRRPRSPGPQVASSAQLSVCTKPKGIVLKLLPGKAPESTPVAKGITPNGWVGIVLGKVPPKPIHPKVRPALTDPVIDLSGRVQSSSTGCQS